MATILEILGAILLIKWTILFLDWCFVAPKRMRRELRRLARQRGLHQDRDQVPGHHDLRV